MQLYFDFNDFKTWQCVGLYFAFQKGRSKQVMLVWENTNHSKEVRETKIKNLKTLNV